MTCRRYNLSMNSKTNTSATENNMENTYTNKDHAFDHAQINGEPMDTTRYFGCNHCRTRWTNEDLGGEIWMDCPECESDDIWEG